MRCSNPKCPSCYPQQTTELEATPAKPFPFDEKLRFVDRENSPACNVPYVITLETGEKYPGTSDADGCTMRIGTEEPKSVRTVTLAPPEAARKLACCGARYADLDRERVEVQSYRGFIAETNERNLGGSVAPVSIPIGKKRPLTFREVAAAQTVFGRGLNYQKVWVHYGGWWVFMGKQDPNTAVTPNGEMYFPEAIYQYDFASPELSPRWAALFMHEMVHVWQYQMGYGVKRHGLTVTSQGSSAYAYRLAPDSRLSDFNMEQQGDLMSDYYMICVRNDNANALNPGKDPKLLRKVMEPFLANPRDKVHLPR